MANNITIGGQTYDLSTQSGRADARTNNPGLIVDATSVYNPSTGVQTNAGGSTGSVPSSGQVAAPQAIQPTAQQYANAINQAVAALNSSDLKAFNEQVSEWNQTFGFNKEQFAEQVRQYNQNFGITQAGVTGLYNGQPTLQAQNQAANFLGTYQGQQTLQAQLQAFNEQQALAQLYGQGYATFGAVPAGTQTLAAQLQAFNEQQQAAAQTYQQQYNLAALASQLQANPFQQAAVLGQAQRILSGQGVAGFQAPNTVQGVGTAGGQTQGGLGYLQQIIDDIKNPQANQTSMNQFLASTPTPNQINSPDFLRSAPTTQNLVLQAMQEKYGIDPNDALAQIKNTLPQFNAPTTLGAVRR